VGLARDHVHLAIRERTRAVELVGRDDHRPAVRRCGPEDGVEHLAALGVQAGVRLVEQQQPRVAREGDGEREPAALPGGQTTVRDTGEALEPEVIAPAFALDDFEMEDLPEDGEIITNRTYDELKLDRMSKRSRGAAR